MLTLFNARTLVIFWIIGFLIAGIGMSILQDRTAAACCWGANGGWQTEIAIWNLGVILMLVGVLRSKKQIEPYILPGLLILSTAFCVNHIIALIEYNGIYMTNLLAAALNGGGVLLISLYYALGSRVRTS